MSIPNVNLFLNYVESLAGKDREYIKDNIEQRSFYSCNKNFDYVGYVNKGSKEQLDYISYSGNNEKSLGIFNENGLLNENDIKELRNKLRTTKSVIWHGVISFTEDFGNRYCDTYEKAYNLMKTELPRFFKNAGLSAKNIVWYAGFHTNTDNKHIHFSFFEKEPLQRIRDKEGVQFSKGHIAVGILRKFKQSIELKLLDLSSAIVKERTSITTAFKRFEREMFVRNLTELVEILPLTGRMSYDSTEIEKYKKKIDNVVNAMIMSNASLRQKLNDFDVVVSKRDDEIRNINKRMKQDENKNLLKEKYKLDLYRRLGNIVLGVVKDIRKEQRKFNYDTKKRLVQKRLDKAKRRALFKNCERLNYLSTQEVINAFEEFLHKLDEANYKRLQEEGVLSESL